MERLDSCEYCSERLTVFNKKKVCASCGGNICSQCRIKERFCYKCYKKLPDHIKQKYRIYNSVPSILFVTLACICLCLSIFLAPPWPTLVWDDFIIKAIPNFILIGLFIIFLIIGWIFPHIGNERFAKWMRKSEESVDENSQTNYNETKFYSYKRRIINYLERTNNAIILSITIVLNLSLMVIWSIQFESDFENISVFAGVIFGLTITMDFLLLIIALSFYKNHKGTRHKRRISILFMVIFNLFLIFLAYGAVIWLWVSIGGIFGIDLYLINLLRTIHTIVFFILHISLICLAILLLKSREMLSFNTELDENLNRKSRNWSIKLIRFLIIFPFAVLLLFFLFVSFYILTGDIFMFPTYFSTSLIIGLYVPTGIVLAKIVGKKKRKGYRQRFWTIVNITAIIVIINLLPIIHTTAYTNTNLDVQFGQVFGQDWEDQIPEDKLETMRKYQYSLFDNVFNFHIPSNSKFNIHYLTDFPDMVDDNESVIKHEFYFDAYLPPDVKFGDDNDDDEDNDVLLPVIIMMHGEVEDKGPWNANQTSQYLANQGYLVCDMNYGYITHNEHGKNYNGYSLRAVVEQIGSFTSFLYQKREYYHADLTKTYFSGRHLGGGLSLICGLGYETTLKGVFCNEMKVRGVVPYYPIADLGEDNTSFYEIYKTKDYPFLEGSSDPNDSDYNPDWINLNPIKIIDNEISPKGSLPPVLLFCGTHDYLILLSYIDNFVEKMRENEHDIIAGYHLLGSDGYDGNHASPWGQSVIYYYERFIALTS